jgi:glycosyltransferase involved in cell wall biosynthesis
MPGPVRVLHVTAGNLFGGVETLLVTLGRHSGEAFGIDSEFALCFEGRLSESLRAVGAPVHFLGGVRLRDPLRLAKANRSLRQTIARGRFDVVITHGAWPHLAFGWSAKRGGARLVTWWHGAPLRRGVVDRLADAVRPDLVIANSWHTLGLLERRVGAIRAEVLYAPVEPQPVSPERRATLRRELNVPEQAVVIVLAARLERWKGHELLLRAAAQLGSRLAVVPRIWICGGPQRPHEALYLDELTRWVRDAGASARVSFLGQRSDVPDVLCAADIFCQPNVEPEPFGIVFVEALYAGLPVVTTAMGGGQEIVDSSCGLLVPPQPEPLAAALARLVEDTELRRRLGTAAPARARQLCDPRARMRDLARILSG